MLELRGDEARTTRRAGGGVYWPGNAAKTRIVRDVLAAGARRIFDHGCGDGGAWPEILAAHPDVELVAWDPDPDRAVAATRRLKGRRAVVHPRMPRDVRADAIVSFSVFEHVRDRAAYLAAARTQLAPGGRFYLNYDDGHFRVAFDVDAPSRWPAQARTWAHNVAARLGWPRDYQRRVVRTDADAMVAAAGFRCIDVWYGNVDAFKGLAKRIPSGAEGAFHEWWLRVEEELGTFAADGRELRGDACNLWTTMASRTLVLERR